MLLQTLYQDDMHEATRCLINDDMVRSFCKLLWMSTLVFHHLPTEIKQRAMQEIYRVLTPGGRFLLADFGKPEGVLLRSFFALGRLVQADEARYIQDNMAGKLPLFLKEAGFATKEILPRYKGVQFLLAMEDA